MAQVIGVTVAEGHIEDVKVFRSEEYAEAFASGFTSGASHYGAGSAFVFLEDDANGYFADIEGDTWDSEYTRQSQELAKKARERIAAKRAELDA